MTTFEYDGKTYELKMTRAAARDAEDKGLTLNTLEQKPFVAISLLFYAALYKYKITPSKAANMLDELLDSGKIDFTELFETLTTEYVALLGLGEPE